MVGHEGLRVVLPKVFGWESTSLEWLLKAAGLNTEL